MAGWLAGACLNVLMWTWYVDTLYQSGIEELDIPSVSTPWHRYVVDLNRLPEDVDKNSLEDASNLPGSFTTGLHWSKTTRGHTLMAKPISRKLHQQLLVRYYQPFHHQVEECYKQFKKQGCKKVYHLDAHSMPSVGTPSHVDPGQTRPQVVVSDRQGTSCEAKYKQLVVDAYKRSGFQVALNWPYQGGRIVQTYGHPSQGQHALQVEINRNLYMDEETKQWDRVKGEKVTLMIVKALSMIKAAL